MKTNKLLYPWFLTYLLHLAHEGDTRILYSWFPTLRENANWALVAVWPKRRSGYFTSVERLQEWVKDGVLKCEFNRISRKPVAKVANIDGLSLMGSGNRCKAKWVCFVSFSCKMKHLSNYWQKFYCLSKVLHFVWS